MLWAINDNRSNGELDEVLTILEASYESKY